MRPVEKKHWSQGGAGDGLSPVVLGLRVQEEGTHWQVQHGVVSDPFCGSSRLLVTYTKVTSNVTCAVLSHTISGLPKIRINFFMRFLCFFVFVFFWLV